MKLKSLLIVAGAAGAVAAVLKRRGTQDIPQPVKDAAQSAAGTVQGAAQSAAQTVQQAAENAPGPVQQAVEAVTPSGGEDAAGSQTEERYEPPAEALAQQPTEAGGPPSDASPLQHTTPAEGLNVPQHDLPEGVVMPDTSDDDPLVREQENMAEADAASIGGNAGEEELDPAMRGVVEGIGDENEETFEAREGTERSNRELES